MIAKQIGVNARTVREVLRDRHGTIDPTEIARAPWVPGEPLPADINPQLKKLIERKKA